MKKRKGFKILVSLMAIAVVFSMVLAGCGMKGSENPTQTTSADAQSQSTEASTQADATAESLDPVTLTWYFMGQYPQVGQEEVFKAANEMIKAKINTTVNFVPSSFGDYDQKMQVVIASGENFDLCFTSNWTNNYIQNVSKGAFIPLDDLMVKYAPKAFASVPEVFWNATRVNGKIYGFVNQQISARTPDMGTPKRLYDKYKDILDPAEYAGKINATTVFQLEPYIKACITDNPHTYWSANIADMEGPFFNQDFLMGWNVPGAVDFTDMSMKVVNQYESPQMITYAKLMRDWNAKGYLNSKERISRKTDDSTDGKAKKILMFIGGTYKPGSEVQDSAMAGEPFVSFPAGEAYLTTGGIIADLHAISKTSGNPERSMMLLELIHNDQELFNTLICGVKGKNWKINDDGFLEKLGEGNNAYNPNSDWMFGSNFNAYVQVGQSKTIWDDTRKINNTATPSPMLGFNFSPDSVKAEIGKCTAVVDEYYRSIELGVASEAKYNEFLAKLKTAGSEKVIAEMQKQVDAWKASR